MLPLSRIFSSISPLDHRYYLENKEIFDPLSEYISENASVTYELKVETTLLKAYVRRFLRDPEPAMKKIDEEMAKITVDEVYKEEQITQHHIRALVRVIKRKLPEEIGRYVHLGATSMDIVDSANVLRIKLAVQNIILPLILKVEDLLLKITEKETATLQAGRTHGQLAVPITAGFTFAEYLMRLDASSEFLFQRSEELCGKLSGAVGGYHATSLIVSSPEELEKEVLAEIGLSISPFSTQIVNPEPLLRVITEMGTVFGIVANLADDLRHLQRSEIAEIQEIFTEDQVGSSTMPHKRNPWNSEHIKSLWKVAMPRILTVFMDQISEHQRDLTNSASGRFLMDYIALLAAALHRSQKVLSSLHINHKMMERNVELGQTMLAEPLYILLTMGGIPDAYEKVRKLSHLANKESISLTETIKKREHSLWEVCTRQLQSVGIDPEVFFSHPRHYLGKVIQKIQSSCALAKDHLHKMHKKLNTPSQSS